MPTFYFIPKTVLGAVIITAVYPMIEYHEILPMWRGRSNTYYCMIIFTFKALSSIYLGMELLPFGVTYFCCLLVNMEYGILIGAQLHLLLVVYEASRSKSTFTHYKVRFKFQYLTCL